MMRSQGGRTGEGGTESVLLGWACDETLGLLVLVARSAPPSPCSGLHCAGTGCLLHACCGASRPETSALRARQGCLLLAGLSLAWIWATRSRQRALADLLRQRRLARADPSARASSVRAPAPRPGSPLCPLHPNTRQPKSQNRTGGCGTQTPSPTHAPTVRPSQDRELPPVAVVLPVRNVSPERVANWRSQLASDYAGALDFVFVVEAETDPAVRRRHPAQASTPARLCAAAGRRRRSCAAGAR